MSPTLNGSFALQRFKRCNAIEIDNRIMFDFYHIYLPLLSSIVTVAAVGFNMAAGSADVRVTLMVSESSSTASSSMGIVTV